MEIYLFIYLIVCLFLGQATPIPSPSPVSQGKKPKPIPNDGTKKKKTSGSPVPDDLKKASPVPQSPNTTVPAIPPTQVAKPEEKNENKPSSEHGNVETCVVSVKECKTIKNVVACIKSFDEGNSHCYPTSLNAYVLNWLCLLSIGFECSIMLEC